MLIDTHCHIHEADYPLDRDEVIVRARAAGVQQMICVGTSEESSRAALAFAAAHDNIFAAIGVHPHEAKDGWSEIPILAGGHDSSTRSTVSANANEEKKLVAVGEIGLDYFYSHSPREVQIEALEAQIQLSLDHDLPIIFHVREASSPEGRVSVWRDFWPILDNFHGVRGELHSFTDTTGNLEQAMGRGFYIGVNGISTFTKDEAQRAMFQSIPLEKMLLETDAPFLTPTPFRGKVNEPAFVRQVAEFHATNRGISLEELGRQTTANARALFAL